jgi:hypothetical protein
MQHSVERWAGSMPDRRESKRVQRARQELSAETYLAKQKLRAIADVNEFGMLQAVRVKRWQRQLESLEPDAAETLAFMASNAVLAMAEVLQEFGSEVS